MLGVILCGGKSSRMGTDKGLIAFQSNNNTHPITTWTDIASKKLVAAGVPFVVSVNKEQYPTYSTLFSSDQLVVDNEKLTIRGPLYGLLSVHMQYPDQALFVLACDMPLMTTEILKELLQQHNQHPKQQAFLYTNNNEPEPLCAIYKPNALQYILYLYQTGQLLKHSMKFMLEHIPVFSIPLNEEQKKSFQNFNAHSELNGL